MTEQQIFMGLGFLLAVNGVLLIVVLLRLGRDRTDDVLNRFDQVALAAEKHERAMSAQLSEARGEQTHQAGALREEVHKQIATLGDTFTSGQKDRLDAFAEMLRNTLDTQNRRLTELSAQSQNQQELLRQKVDEKLGALSDANEKKLDEMRKTVDEKLHNTLEKRLGESFKHVSDRLEAVHRGLGEMQTLANGVGDLKRILTNVKTRGGWGEVQLSMLLAEMLTQDQYQTNVAVKPDSNERVEFAICLPGKDDDMGAPVYLPIDSKFPKEDYERLTLAADAADAEAVEAALKALETRIKQSAKEISQKYVEPPYTTNFAIMYLPTEGLFAEVVRRPGLVETLQTSHRIVVAGPTTFAALLNSLQMGFRTLAIEKRSGEVWKILHEVKSEFGKFGTALGAVKKKLQEANNHIEKVETRTRVMGRKLQGVEESAELPKAPVLAFLEDDDDDDDGDDLISEVAE